MRRVSAFTLGPHQATPSASPQRSNGASPDRPVMSSRVSTGGPFLMHERQPRCRNPSQPRGQSPERATESCCHGCSEAKPVEVNPEKQSPEGGDGVVPSHPSSSSIHRGSAAARPSLGPIDVLTHHRKGVIDIPPVKRRIGSSDERMTVFHTFPTAPLFVRHPCSVSILPGRLSLAEVV